MKKILFVLIILLNIFLIGCTKDNEKKAFEEDYAYMKGQEHVYVKGTYDEVVNAFTVNQGVNVILFAFDPDFYECPYCMAVVPIINEIALEESINKIIYLDIYEMRMNNTAQYQLLLGYLDSKVDDLIVRDNVKKLIVPDLYVVKDGEILGHHIATIKDENGNFIKDLTEAQTNELKGIYRQLFELTK